MALSFPPSFSAPKYHHHRNPDGNWTSICLKCFMTAARARTEAVLAREEQEHVCSANPKFSEPKIPPGTADGRSQRREANRRIAAGRAILTADRASTSEQSFVA